jgi:hypothetical protein
MGPVNETRNEIQSKPLLSFVRTGRDFVAPSFFFRLIKELMPTVVNRCGFDENRLEHAKRPPLVFFLFPQEFHPQKEEPSPN